MASNITKSNSGNLSNDNNFSDNELDALAAPTSSAAAPVSKISYDRDRANVGKAKVSDGIGQAAKTVDDITSNIIGTIDSELNNRANTLGNYIANVPGEFMNRVGEAVAAAEVPDAAGFRFEFTAEG